MIAPSENNDQNNYCSQRKVNNAKLKTENPKGFLIDFAARTVNLK